MTNHFIPYKSTRQAEAEMHQETSELYYELSLLSLALQYELCTKDDGDDTEAWNGFDDGDGDADDVMFENEDGTPPELPAPKSWGRPETLPKHFKDHGKDFGAKSPRDYAKQANDFFKQAQSEKLPMVVGRDGVIRAYDPKTNTFGSYNPDGTTKTFYKPRDGGDYFKEQIDYDLSKGGRLVNPLPDEAVVPTEIPAFPEVPVVPETPGTFIIIE